MTNVLFDLEYDIIKNGNFKWKEFVCKDGSLKINKGTYLLFERLQILRNIIGVITIESGYRSPEYNSNLKDASPISRHMDAHAVDVNWNTKVWSINMVSLIAEGLGLYVIKYPWGLHLDVRELI